MEGVNKLPEWAMNFPIEDIIKRSIEHSVSPILITAIIMTESSGVKDSMKYEPGYKWTYHPREFADNLGITAETEEMLQKTSWGYMQVMGAVCREYGFTDRLFKILDDDNSIVYGTKLLKKLSEKYDSESDIIAAYNAGKATKTEGGLYINQRYVDKVSGYLFDLRALI